SASTWPLAWSISTQLFASIDGGGGVGPAPAPGTGNACGTGVAGAACGVSGACARTCGAKAGPARARTRAATTDDERIMRKRHLQENECAIVADVDGLGTPPAHARLARIRESRRRQGSVETRGVPRPRPRRREDIA